MPADFEWRTDEDDSHWEEQLPPNRARSGAEQPGGRLHFGRPILILIMLLAAVTAGILYALASRQVEQATAAAETEVLQSFLLIQQAAAADDLDLFLTLVDDDHRNWYDLQYDLFRHHLYLDRPSLGLTARPILSATEILSSVQIALSPDLISATLTIHQPYAVGGLDNLTETVVLDRTEIYRRLDGDWHLDELPDDEAFWGTWITNRGRNLTLIYPRRDEEIGQRLAVELDKLVGQICDELEPDACPDSDTQVRLARRADSLMRLNDNFERLFTNIDYFSLPAPSLVGRPLDEAGYQALYRAYASWIVVMLFDELRDGQLALSRYGLRLPPAPYEPLPAVTAFIEEPPEPWPDEDIVTVCSGGNGAAQVMSYDPRANKWHWLPLGEMAPLLSQAMPFGRWIVQGAPDNDGILMTAGTSNADQTEFTWQTFLWRDGQAQRLFGLDGPYNVLPDTLQRVFNPGGRYLIIYTSEGDSNRTEFGYFRYDDCLSGDCELQQTPGLPVFSPDERHILVSVFSDDPGPRITLTDPAGRTWWTIDNVMWPFWLDNESFLWIQAEWSERAIRPGEYATQLVRGRLAPDTVAGYVLETVLDEDDLRQATPPGQRPDHLDIQMVLTQPGRPDRWFVSAADRSAVPGRQYSFLYDAGRDELFAVPEMTGSLTFGEPFLSPEGRFLAVYDYINGRVWVLDLASDPADPQVRSFMSQANSVDWSADGHWLVLNGQLELVLINPFGDFERRVPYELSNCQGFVWTKVNPVEPPGERP